MLALSTAQWIQACRDDGQYDPTVNDVLRANPEISEAVQGQLRDEAGVDGRIRVDRLARVVGTPAGIVIGDQGAWWDVIDPACPSGQCGGTAGCQCEEES